MTQEFQPGPRQTVDFVFFEPYGPGRLVWDNGPAMFLPAVGAPVPLLDVGLVGYTRNAAGDWAGQRPVHTAQGTFFVDVLTKGEAYHREFSPKLGIGWMVTLPDWMYRFEADSGTTVEFQVAGLRNGRPDRLLLDGTDEINWMTYTLVDGSEMVFRRHGPPPEGAS